MKYLKYLIILFLCQPLYSMTVNEYYRQIRWDIYDTTTTYRNSKFTDADLLERMNIIQDKVVADTYCLFTSTLVTPTTNQQIVNLPSDCIKIKRVAFITVATSTTAYKRLEGKTLEGMDITYTGGWENTSAGLPREYLMKGNNTLWLYPKVSGTYAQSNALKIEYYKRANPMVNGTDEPFDSDVTLRAYHEIILLGVVAWCKRTMGMDNTREKNEYDVLIQKLKENLKYRTDLDENIPVKRQ